MSGKCALIVDDSKSARAVLRKLLAGHSLEVDEAASAEEALEYLRHRRPDVVFMDHMMPGMNGFEAVKVIKEDPATATTPIVMYTSKHGEVYVGQARALGALDVLPKEVKPAELFRILRNLNLVEERREAPAPVPTHATTSAPTADVAPSPLLPPAAIEEIARITATQIDITAHLARQQAQFGSQLTMLRHDLLGNCQSMINDAVEVLRKEPEPEPTPVPPAARPARQVPAYALLLFVLLMLPPIFWMYGLYNDARSHYRTAQQTLAQIPRPTAVRAGEDTARSLATLEQRWADATRDKAALIGAIEWALNRDNLFDHDRQALGDDTLTTLRELTTHLSAAGFRGTVRVNVQFARFCLTRNVGGMLEVAADDTPVESCELGYPARMPANLTAQQSIEFASFVGSSPLLADGAIRIELAARDSAAAQDSDETLAAARTAGEWNRAARRYNRIEFSILPDKGTRVERPASDRDSARS